MNKKIHALYFSPTGTTKKVVSGIAKILFERSNTLQGMGVHDFTLPENRKAAVSYAAEDLVVVGVPVYAGRVPNILLSYLNSILGNGAFAIPIVVYGNRNFDDALIELKDIMTANGFNVIAAAAFIGEHSFSTVLAKKRPDEHDMTFIQTFANQILQKISVPAGLKELEVRGATPYRKYYSPRNRNNEPVDIRKVTPKTADSCIDCRLCVRVCPMGSIAADDVSKINGICIKCGACIKKCPVNAKYYDDEDYLRHQHELEIEFAARREPELFI
jgi:NAD-dependent dihydropyrimidine dehydrogenase PreA subunit